MIGIFGGTFDPVHYGHINTVKHVREALDLEQIRLVPLANAVHRNAPRASAEQRLHMLQAACQDEPKLVVDRIELDRAGASYTVHTMQQLKKEFPDRTLNLIIGADAFEHFSNWYKPESILELANLVVMQRPGHRINFDHPLFEKRIADTTDGFKDNLYGKIIALEVPQLPISSTLVREAIKQKKSLDGLLPPAVIDLIQQWQLYAT